MVKQLLVVIASRASVSFWTQDTVDAVRDGLRKVQV